MTSSFSSNLNTPIMPEQQLKEFPVKEKKNLCSFLLLIFIIILVKN